MDSRFVTGNSLRLRVNLWLTSYNKEFLIRISWFPYNATTFWGNVSYTVSIERKFIDAFLTKTRIKEHKMTKEILFYLAWAPHNGINKVHFVTLQNIFVAKNRRTEVLVGRLRCFFEALELHEKSFIRVETKEM